MPIYEYVCHECCTQATRYRSVADRNALVECSMGHRMELMFSVPALAIWNEDRSFPNAVKFGDGKFPTKQAYDSHLKANDMAETRIDGKIYRPHGNRVIRGSR